MRQLYFLSTKYLNPYRFCTNKTKYHSKNEKRNSVRYVIENTTHVDEE